MGRSKPWAARHRTLQCPRRPAGGGEDQEYRRFMLALTYPSPQIGGNAPYQARRSRRGQHVGVQDEAQGRLGRPKGERAELGRRKLATLSGSGARVLPRQQKSFARADQIDSLSEFAANEKA